MHTFLRSCGKPLWWLALLCGAWTAAHSAEPVAEQDPKAAYIFNFIQFIEWPEKQGKRQRIHRLCIALQPVEALAHGTGKQADHPGPDHQDPAPGSRHPAGVRSPDRAQP